MHVVPLSSIRTTYRVALQGLRAASRVITLGAGRSYIQLVFAQGSRASNPPDHDTSTLWGHILGLGYVWFEGSNAPMTRMSQHLRLLSRGRGVVDIQEGSPLCQATMSSSNVLVAARFGNRLLQGGQDLAVNGVRKIQIDSVRIASSLGDDVASSVSSCLELPRVSGTVG